MDRGHLMPFIRSLTEVRSRRTALRTAVGSATLVAAGLVSSTPASEARSHHAKQGASAAKHKKHKKKRAVAPPPPPPPPSPPSPPPSPPSLSTQVKISATSDPLPVTAGSIVTAVVQCGGEGTVVSCGYQTTFNDAQLVNALVIGVQPTLDRSACGAVLIRTTETGSTAGATIFAIAICLI